MQEQTITTSTIHTLSDLRRACEEADAAGMDAEDTRVEVHAQDGRAPFSLHFVETT